MSTDRSTAPTTSEAALELDRLRRSALVAADVPALRDLFLPSAVVIHANGMLDSGARYLDRLADGDFRYEALQADDVTAVAVEGTAVVQYAQTARMLIGSEPRTTRSRCASTWTRLDGRLRLVAFQSTPLRTAD